MVGYRVTGLFVVVILRYSFREELVVELFFKGRRGYVGMGKRGNFRL